MNLPTSGRTICKETFKELNSRRHDERSIPVFNGESSLLLARFFHLLRLRLFSILIPDAHFNRRMMLQNILPTKDLAELVHCLVNDARVRDSIDDTRSLILVRIRVRCNMGKSECK